MYQYNPKMHVKIWLSNRPNVFMNLENQIRLINMREKNPSNTIYLVYDSTLLTLNSLKELHVFCKEHHCIPIDAHTIQNELQSEYEHRLYLFYLEEIHNLKSGGNLGVASDILRWLSPVFKLGTYTDFDVPIDTSTLPEQIEVDAPLLLNVGSLKMGKKEFILANNDFISIVDELAASQYIARVQKGILDRLSQYDNDFFERTECELGGNSIINRYLIKFMKNRPESIYITKSREIIPPKTSNTSLRLRSYINDVMTDKIKFLNLNKKESNEPYQSVIYRLRKELQAQLNLVKYLFFNKEYASIKRISEQNDNRFLTNLMKKEHELYLKSIVVCTSGPIEISNALFNGYVVDVDKFVKEVQPLSFNYYGLQKHFQSKNSISLHENIFGMLKFLSVDNGELNDVSWLDSGKKLQLMRTKKLISRQKNLASSLPQSITLLKNEIKIHIKKAQESPYKLFFRSINARREALELILTCFNQEENEFNISRFKEIVLILDKNRYKQKLIEDLKILCHDATLFSLTKDKKIKLDPCRLG